MKPKTVYTIDLEMPGSPDPVQFHFSADRPAEHVIIACEEGWNFRLKVDATDFLEMVSRLRLDLE
jgi:hypothetical protein